MPRLPLSRNFKHTKAPIAIDFGLRSVSIGHARAAGEASSRYFDGQPDFPTRRTSSRTGWQVCISTTTIPRKCWNEKFLGSSKPSSAINATLRTARQSANFRYHQSSPSHRLRSHGSWFRAPTRSMKSSIQPHSLFMRLSANHSHTSPYDGDTSPFRSLGITIHAPTKSSPLKSPWPHPAPSP